MKHRARGMVVCGLLAAGAWARAAESPGMEKVVPRTREELDGKIREVLSRTRTPAVGYAVVSREGVTVAAGLGKADVASGRDATGSTLFRIGSISKMFVSLSMLMLQEEGRLALDDVVRSRIPDVGFENPWEPTDPVRIVHLLEHTTGFDDLTFREYAHGRLVTLKEGLDYEPRSRKSRWRPGTRFSYCNSGPPMAAYILETVTGQRFEDFVHERLFVPLEMDTATYFKPDPEQAATLYHPDGTTPYPYWEIILRPSGSINASAAELGHLAVMLLNRGSYNGTTLLPPAAIDRLERPTSTYAARAGVTAGYGLGNYASFGGGFELHGHNGGVEGGLAHLAYIPEVGVGYVAMINSGSGEALEDVGHLLRNFATRDLAKPKPPAAVSVADGPAREWTGWYLPDSPRQEFLRFLERLVGPVRIRIDGEKLTLSRLLGKKEEYVAVTERTFRKADRPAATLALLDTAEGRLIQFGQTARPVSAVLVLLQTGLAALCLLLMASAPLFALVWIPRRLFAGLRRAPHLGARAVSLVAVLCFASAVTLFIVSDDDTILRFGNPTVWSVGFCVLTIAFAVLAIYGLFLAVRVPPLVVNRAARWHTILLASGNTLAAAYLFYWGIIGLRSWV